MEFTKYLGEMVGLRKNGNEMFLFMRIDQSMIDSVNRDRDIYECYDFLNDETDDFERLSEEEVLSSYYGIKGYKGLYFKKFPITEEIYREMEQKYLGKVSEILKFPFPAKVVLDSERDLMFFYFFDEEVDITV